MYEANYPNNIYDPVIRHKITNLYPVKHKSSRKSALPKLKHTNKPFYINASKIQKNKSFEKIIDNFSDSNFLFSP